MIDKEHHQCTTMVEHLQALLELDIRRRSAAYGMNVDVTFVTICNEVHQDGEEMVIAFPNDKRVIRIRVDMVDREYLEASKAKLEADEGIPDIEMFLKEHKGE